MDEDEEAVVAKRFPKAPGKMGDYWDPPANPGVERRWLTWTHNGHMVNVFWFGNCLYCDYSVWALADGTTLNEMANHALVTLWDDEEHGFAPYRACYRCATNESRARSVITYGRERDDAAPLVWPAKHPINRLAVGL
jgi:hypothetical protein